MTTPSSLIEDCHATYHDAITADRAFSVALAQAGVTRWSDQTAWPEDCRAAFRAKCAADVAFGEASRRYRAAQRGQATLPAIGIGLAVMLTATFGIAWMGGHLAQYVDTMARLGAALLGG